MNFEIKPRSRRARTSWLAFVTACSAMGLAGCVEGTPFSATINIYVDNEAAAEDLKILSMFKAGFGPLHWSTLAVTEYDKDLKPVGSEPIWPWSTKMMERWPTILDHKRSEAEKMSAITGEDIGSPASAAECQHAPPAQRSASGRPFSFICRTSAVVTSTIVLSPETKAQNNPIIRYDYQWRVTRSRGNGSTVDCNTVTSTRSASACVLRVHGDTDLELRITRKP